ncbi:MAG: acetoacetate decarboxylase family protein [Desulfurococcales archaeon]|nr:acetoacetate decarboxylase family protein [Desulfurococcales archaeon]
MILKGKQVGFSIPFNAPLYKEPPWLYRDAEALIALVTFERESVEPILPEGVETLGGPVMGAFWISYYPFSTLGPYYEAIIAVQVGYGSNLAYYIPYIYVTNDAALAAGREVLGAPKKLASILLNKGETIYGSVSRGGVKLFELELSPEGLADEEMLRGILQEELTLLSVRSLPPVGGKGVAQLIEWYVKTWFRKTYSNAADAWTGSVLVRHSSGVSDPIGELRVHEVLGGFYVVMDMELGVKGIVREWMLT